MMRPGWDGRNPGGPDGLSTGSLPTLILFRDPYGLTVFPLENKPPRVDQIDGVLPKAITFESMKPPAGLTHILRLGGSVQGRKHVLEQFCLER